MESLIICRIYEDVVKKLRIIIVEYILVDVVLNGGWCKESHLDIQLSQMLQVQVLHTKKGLNTEKKLKNLTKAMTLIQILIKIS